MDTHEEELCPACREPYRLYSEDVDLERERLRCHACGAEQDLKDLDPFLLDVLEFGKAYEEGQRPVRCTPPPPRPPLLLPRGFRLEEDLHRTALSWRGLGGLRLTRLEATRDALTVHRRLLGVAREPLRLERRELVQLYGQAHMGFLGECYRLCALTRRGHREILASGFARKEPVLYLEQTLERRLGIEDSWVKGELAERPPPESWRLWFPPAVSVPVTEEPSPPPAPHKT